MTLRELHARLEAAAAALMAASDLPGEASSDTCYAIGYALGVTLRAKALVGRDIDDTEKAADARETV